MKPTCYVMVGLPGTGKSTYVSEQLMPTLSDDAFIYSTDRLIEEAAENRGQTYNEAFRDMIGPATQQMEHWLDIYSTWDNVDVVWDQTNTGRKKREKIVRRMKDRGYRMEAICFLHPDPGEIEDMKEWRRRLASREGKTIPEHVLENMTENFTVPSIPEGFDRVITMDIHHNVIVEMET